MSVGWSYDPSLKGATKRDYVTDPYRTSDELEYIERLERRRNVIALESAAKYVRLRQWPASVDVDAVAAAVQMALSRVRGRV